jgi:hypothetical protein
LCIPGAATKWTKAKNSKRNIKNSIEVNGFDEERDELLLESIYGDPGVAHLRRPPQDEYLTWFSALQPQRCKGGIMHAVRMVV